MKNLLFTVCGRAGSKGIKNKNIRNFCGYPLPYYSLAIIDLFMKKTGGYSFDVVVSTDSKELIEIANKNPFIDTFCINRKKELSGDLIPKISVISNCMKIMSEQKNKKYDLVIDLDITSPLRTVEDLCNLIKVSFDTGADVVTSVTESRRNPYFNMVKKTESGYKKVIDSNYTARQQAPEIFDMNASLYAYRPEFLLSGKGILDGYCECIFMYDTGILDLDHERDFELMQVIAQHLFDTDNKYGEVRRFIEKRMRVEGDNI